jgi:hypothetical protein
MKGLIITGAIVVVLAGGGLWWGLRRAPADASLLAGPGLGDPGGVFTAQPSGPGTLIKLTDTQVPLRSFHWLPPLAGGYLAAQVLNQNDRQRVALFHDGALTDTLLILKPAGVNDAFWHFAILKAAAMVPDGRVVLLYQAGEPASTELPLVLSVDVASQQVVWSYRGAGERLASAEGTQPAVYLYGGKAAIQRLPLGAAAAAGPQHPAAKTIELPAEVAAVEDLLPTGSWSFLASHGDGLSAYQASTGWKHFPEPEDRGVACADWRSSLVRAGRDIWWQAVPGHLVKVRPDGRPLAQWQAQLPPEDPFARDARLWRLLGADPAGSLWFALGSPAPLPQAATPPPADPAVPPVPDGQGALPSGAGMPEVPEDWSSYVAQGLDRVYRWNPARKTMERTVLRSVWPSLNPPASVQAPGGLGLVPAAGALLGEGAGCAWWLPLAALPMEPAPVQADVQAM